jgi:hypothetical protein
MAGMANSPFKGRACWSGKTQLAILRTSEATLLPGQPDAEAGLIFRFPWRIPDGSFVRARRSASPGREEKAESPSGLKPLGTGTCRKSGSVTAASRKHYKPHCRAWLDPVSDWCLTGFPV